MLKKIVVINLLVLFCLTICTDVSAQRSGTKKRIEKKEKSDDTTENTRSVRDRGEKDETVSLRDKLNYEISVGNITFQNGFGTTLKPHVAYKFYERLSVGAALRVFYEFRNNITIPDESRFSYGPSVFGRFKLSNEIFLQTEYNYMSYDFGRNSDRLSEGSPMVGGGYMSGYGPWMFGIQLLFITNDAVRNIEGSALDYWFSFSYNF